MGKKAFSGIMLALLLIGILPLAFNIRLVAAEPLGPPPTEWSRTYGGAGYDAAVSVFQTVDGGYAIAGYTDSYGAGSNDFWLVKTDSAGTMQWSQTYGGTGWDLAVSVVQTVDGGYALAGSTASYGAGSSDFWLVKTATLTITIDIKPGIFPNSVNLGEQGLLPVAILGSGSFNVESINPDTLKLDGVSVSLRGSAKAQKIAYSIKDVNKDGFLDIMAFFSVQELVNLGALTLTTTELQLTGYLWDGIQITGTDSCNPFSPS